MPPAKKKPAAKTPKTPKITTDVLIRNATYDEKLSRAERIAKFEEALARPDIASRRFHRCHVAAMTGDLAYLDGATAAELEDNPNIGMLCFTTLGWAIRNGHDAVVTALIEREANLDGALDVAVEYDRDAIAAALLAAGAPLTGRTIGRLSSKTTDALLDRLIAAGLDLNEEDNSIAGWIGMESDLPTGARMAHVARLVARGYKLDATAVRELLEGLHEDVAAEEDIGASVIAFASSRGMKPDKELVTFALDKLPLAAVEALAAAGAVIAPTAKVRSKAPDAKAKQAWLAKRSGAVRTGAAISWNDFARLDGADLSAETVVARIVGPTMFADVPAGTNFETGIEDDDLPATHELFVGEDGAIDYSVRFHMATGSDESYKDHGKAMFDALHEAIAAHHGKPASGKAKWKTWNLDDKELRLDLSNTSSDRPYTRISLTLGPA